ncbi:iron ABC transporter permease [Oceanobacter sp. 3_MG-2023]|uniref:FecCD family ABC transporter permease n=1 Tax=Oceanobacter sp. 3_MG-2023 TaxID=3062622 RepID=UPI0027345691|nr:iron ABC transporter permease [Oceanobacter sp. 3_MG-2023]MDP2506655.1 iron ABC transporter permease [Oceanobacter sp. 3_MG-2023]
MTDWLLKASGRLSYHWPDYLSGRWMLLVGLLSAAILLSLVSGRYALEIQDIVQFFMAHIGWQTMDSNRYELLETLLMEIRLPRLLTAALVGAALAVSGSTYQAVFINPLVSPGLLGVLAGSSFGAALMMVLAPAWWMVQLGAIAGGLLAVVVALGIGRMFGNASTIMLVLGGIFTGALFAGLLALVKYAADPYEQLPAIIYWLMGSLGLANMGDLALYAPLMLAAIIGLTLQGRVLDILTLGDDSATALGLSVSRVRLMLILLATLASALTVSLVGMIGWVGLLAPHIARLLVGPLNRQLIPASALVGAIFMLFADVLARSLMAAELPIGVVTELIGLPVFLLVLRNVRKGWNT